MPQNIRRSDVYTDTYSMQAIKKNARYRRSSSLIGALVCAILFLSVILVSLFFMSRNEAAPSDTPAATPDAENESAYYPYETIPPVTTENTAILETQDLAFIGPPPMLTEPESVLVSIDNTGITRGDLILINKDHPYSFDLPTKQTVFYGNKSPVYTLSGSSISIDAELFPLFDRMLVDFSNATGCKDVLITSGYRTMEDQKSIMASRIASMGEEKARLYVAEPGTSEHHSGLAIDMCIFSDGKQYYFPEHEAGAWIIENAPRYGFILRYTEEMQELTGCAAEPWHYRYIGTPHAQLVTDLGLCYEQYMEYLHGFTWEEERLFVAEDGTTNRGDGFTLPDSGYMIYSVPANAEASKTDIPLPPGYENYEISGDNDIGFIVTVSLSKAS